MFLFRRRPLAGLPVLLAFVLAGCAHPSQSAVPEQHAPDPDAVPHSREADDVARFIAGMPGKPDSPFKNLEDTEPWKDHRKKLDDAWAKAESPLISGLRQFQKDELNDTTLRNAPVLYPFSGPDALT